MLQTSPCGPPKERCAVGGAQLPSPIWSHSCHGAGLFFRIHAATGRHSRQKLVSRASGSRPPLPRPPGGRSQLAVPDCAPGGVFAAVHIIAQPLSCVKTRVPGLCFGSRLSGALLHLHLPYPSPRLPLPLSGLTHLYISFRHLLPRASSAESLLFCRHDAHTSSPGGRVFGDGVGPCLLSHKRSSVCRLAPHGIRGCLACEFRGNRPSVNGVLFAKNVKLLV